jgi:molecular chaperone DnaK
VKESLKGDDTAAIKTNLEKLNEIWQAASAELYKAAGAQAGGAPGAGAEAGPGGAGDAGSEGSKKGDGPIIDAEVVDEKK